MRALIGVPGGGVWGPVQVGGGVGLLWKMREKGKGLGTAAKELASQCTCVCQNYL